MRTIRAEELTHEAFAPFGAFARMVEPDAEKIGAPPIEFFRDMAILDLGGAGGAALSTCRVEKRDLVIDVTEHHTKTGEACLPLDGDTLMHVAPATPAGSPPPLEKLRVFRVPAGTLITVRPGVWHHAPFAAGDEPVNTLIVLPERTYANDCIVVELGGEDRIRVEA